MIRQDDNRFDLSDSFDMQIVKSACYIFSILRNANTYLNIELGVNEIRYFIRMFQMARSSSGVSLPAVESDLFVNDPNVVHELLGFHVTGRVRKEPIGYQCKPGELEYLWFYNPKTKFHHMVNGDGHGRVVGDSLGRSITVRDGYLESKRVIAVREAL